jgi:hypothetical protein
MAAGGNSGFNRTNAARKSRVSTTSRVSVRPSVPSGPNVSSFHA